jgi:hypothetical protein
MGYYNESDKKYNYKKHDKYEKCPCDCKKHHDDCCKKIKGEVNHYEDYKYIDGEDYCIENKNYYDNYYKKCNHYYITDYDYITDHYYEYDVYHYDHKKEHDCKYYEEKCYEDDYKEKDHWKKDDYKKDDWKKDDYKEKDCYKKDNYYKEKDYDEKYDYYEDCNCEYCKKHRKGYDF